MTGGIPAKEGITVLSLEAAVNTLHSNASGSYQRDSRFYLCNLMLHIYNLCLLVFRSLSFFCAFLEHLVVGLEPCTY